MTDFTIQNKMESLARYNNRNKKTNRASESRIVLQCYINEKDTLIWKASTNILSALGPNPEEVLEGLENSYRKRLEESVQKASENLETYDQRIERYSKGASQKDD